MFKDIVMCNKKFQETHILFKTLSVSFRFFSHVSSNRSDL